MENEHKKKLLELIVEELDYWKEYIDTLDFMKGRIQFFGEELGNMRIPKRLLSQEANEIVIDYFLGLANSDQERERLNNLKSYVSSNQKELASHWQYYTGEYRQD